MNLEEYLALDETEKPFDRMVTNGGFVGAFRTIGCVGDSLSSGEFQSLNDKGETGYHDYFDYSWGQYMAREAGCKVYNFSRGGMTAQEYCESFALKNDFWNPSLACQAYIIALGVNDLCNRHQEIGTTADVNLDDWTKNAKTFTGYYCQIISRLREIQPKARIFLMTMPKSDNEEHRKIQEAHAAILHEIAALYEFTYVLDFYRYAPVYDAEFRRRFYLSGHMNPMGYQLTARMIMSYIDYIIRHNPDDFKQVGFIGTPYHHVKEKW